jgi:hypothetical protein
MQVTKCCERNQETSKETALDNTTTEYLNKMKKIRDIKIYKNKISQLNGKSKVKTEPKHHAMIHTVGVCR